MKRILIAVDNENGTDEMLDYAGKMASLYDATLYILHIARPEPEFVGYDVGPEYIRLDAAREYRDEHRWVQELAKRLDSQNIDARALLIQGYVADEILKQADDIEADLVICGSHKNGFFYNLFLENIAVELSKKSKRPLLVYPMPD
ncbi:universal stress protein [Cryomorphaceae bacterium 1068]|nr:universal stress protein [Cryomorphaceae bacterium 1068]